MPGHISAVRRRGQKQPEVDNQRCVAQICRLRIPELPLQYYSECPSAQLRQIQLCGADLLRRIRRQKDKHRVEQGAYLPRCALQRSDEHSDGDVACDPPFGVLPLRKSGEGADCALRHADRLQEHRNFKGLAHHRSGEQKGIPL